MLHKCSIEFCVFLLFPENLGPLTQPSTPIYRQFYSPAVLGKTGNVPGAELAPIAVNGDMALPGPGAGAEP